MAGLDGLAVAAVVSYIAYYRGLDPDAEQLTEVQARAVVDQALSCMVRDELRSKFMREFGQIRCRFLRRCSNIENRKIEVGALDPQLGKLVSAVVISEVGPEPDAVRLNISGTLTLHRLLVDYTYDLMAVLTGSRAFGVVIQLGVTERLYYRRCSESLDD